MTGRAPESVDEAGSERDPPPSLKPYHNLLKFSFFNATTWMIALGTPLVLLAGQLGASSLEVGIIYAFVFLLLPFQILATSTLPYFGYKRQVIFAWLTRGCFLLVPLFLAFLNPEEPERWMIYALIASSFGFCFFRSIGSCAVMPLIYATLPDKVRGRYFSTDQAVTASSGIFSLLFCALLFRLLDVYDAFFWQYAYAILGASLSVFFLSRVTDPPRPRKTSLGEIARETPRVCLHRPQFQQYLIFVILHASMGTAFIPLQAYYLKVEAGIASETILFYTTFQLAGAILATFVMRNRIDRIGVKPVYRISLLLGACVSLYWLFLISGLAPWLEWGLIPAFFLFGISASQWVTAHLKYMPRICEESKQALHVSVFSSVIGIVGGLTPILWGFLVKIPGSQPGIRIDMFAIFFVALLFSKLVLFFYVPQLTSEYRERPSLQASAGILRPFRFISNLVGIVPTKKEKA